MTKKILPSKTGILAFLLFIGMGTAAQSDFAETRWKKIDSLVKVLHTAKDTTRVKTLHNLSQILYHLNSDSAIGIAHTAYDLAIKLNYLSEAANIMNTISNRHFWRGDINQSIDLGKESISIYEKINNHVEAAKMYRELGLKLTFALRFSEALNSYDKAIHLLSKEKDNSIETSYCLEGKGDVFGALGKYDSAYLSYNRSLQVANEIKDPLTQTEEITSILISMAALFRGVGDMETFNYYRARVNMFKKEATNDLDDFEQAETNLYYQQFDSAYYYFFRPKKTDYRKLTLDRKLSKRSHYIDSMHLGRIYAGLKKYDSAIIYLEAALPYFIDQDRLNIRFEVLLALSISHFGNNNYQKALVHSNHLVQLSKKYELKPKLCEGYKLLSDIYEKTGDKDKGNFYYRKYSELKDELKGDEFKQKLQLYKAEEREKQKQSSIEQLRKEKRWLTSGFILLAISIASIFGLIWVQRKYNAKKRLLRANEMALKYAEDEKRIASLEMLALRSQMNPHFIFNCLNSINRFVLRNDTESASNYLTKFSKLMRMVLENSKQVLIPLAEEVKCLCLLCKIS